MLLANITPTQCLTPGLVMSQSMACGRGQEVSFKKKSGESKIKKKVIKMQFSDELKCSLFPTPYCGLDLVFLS